jgi:hypothetical protein
MCFSALELYFLSLYWYNFVAPVHGRCLVTVKFIIVIYFASCCIHNRQQVINLIQSLRRTSALTKLLSQLDA